MQRSGLGVFLAAVSMTGCVIAPMSPEALSSASAEQVHEVTFTVPVTVNAAYRNTLGKARECWQQTSGVILTQSFFVEGDPFDAELGFARVSVRTGSVVITSVTLKPDGPTSTTGVGRNVKVMGGLAHHVGYLDLPNLAAWAEGRLVTCNDKLLF